jgi:nucleotide-binding universal stress UspA family protein
MFERILVAIDGSPESEKALEKAVDLAGHYNAELIAISVVEFTEVPGTVSEVDAIRESAEKHFHKIGQAAVNFAKSRGIPLRSVVVRGHAADAILDFAQSEAIDLILLGHRGHSKIRRFFLGSTSDRVSEHCHCTVMIVK